MMINTMINMMVSMMVDGSCPSVRPGRLCSEHHLKILRMIRKRLGKDDHLRGFFQP